MQKIKKYIRISLFFLMVLTNTMIVYAKKESDITDKITEQEENIIESQESDWWETVAKYFGGGSIFVLTSGIITIWNAWIERKYDLKEISIEVTMKKEEAPEGYTVFHCNRAEYDGIELEKVNRTSKFSCEMIIIFDKPDKYKPIHNMAIKNLLLEMDGYTFYYSFENGSYKQWKKCSSAENSNMCSVLLQPLCVRPKDKKKVNIIRNFQNPEKVKLYITWRANAKWCSLWSYIFPRKHTVLFKSEENLPADSSSIKRIVSDKIFKGRLK